ncbi:sensor domain-containing diguanylate cyclase [Dasania marina]|uniref:sensor domain-containing diguanylate cyclase n=1 Tax=Dasania marina TaxID=471499 RepID=UPI000380E73F|nr:sensor domain-containing diguanylate cyclase [Dasania marina]
MISPEIPEDEQRRLETLRALKILDSAPEERFDRLTRMAKRMFGVPISLVSLVDSDRQWFKSKQGLDAEETPRDISFCGHAILGEGAFIIPNALDDERFKDNPLVLEAPNIRFYAGCPLKVSNGSKLGTLCLIDKEPRELDEEDIQLLTDLAAMAEQEIAAIQLATLDELTMISNRRGFMTLAEHTVNLCKRKKLPVTVMLFDLDKFKPINDTYGHAEGDRALITFTNVMREVFRESDVFARIGGDEFVALLSDTDDAAVQQVLERLAANLDEVNQAAQRGYDIEYSVGHISFSADHLISVEEMMAEADKLMYEQKKNASR